MNKIRIGLIGLGYAGAVRYLPLMKKMKDFEITGIMDTDVNKAERLAKTFGIGNYSSSDNIDEIRWASDLDAVVIASPPFSHYLYIKEFLLKGKHVLVDKPFVMTPEEAEEVLLLAKENKLILAIMHNFQFSETFNSLLIDINNGRLGTIKEVSCSLLNNPERIVPRWHHDLPWGQFYDESPHSFYMATRLFPNIKFVGCCHYPNSDQNIKTPSSIFVIYTATDDSGVSIPVKISFNFEAPVSEWHVTVVGEQGVSIVDYFRDIYTFLPNDGPHRLINVFATSFFFTYQHWVGQLKPALKYIFGTWLPGHDVVFREFADAILRNGELQYMDGGCATKILEMQHEVMNKSIRQ